MIKCPHCNSVVDSSKGQFCPECGKSLSPAMTNPQGLNNSSVPQPTPPKKKTGLIISAVLAVVVIGGVIRAAAVTQNKDSSDNRNNNEPAPQSQRVTDVSTVTNAGTSSDSSSKSNDGTLADSSALKELEFDTTSLHLLITEAINTYKAEITTTTWNGKTAGEITVHDICVENNIDDSAEYYSRRIDEDTYNMMWIPRWEGDPLNKGDLKAISNNTNTEGYKIDGDVEVYTLADSTYLHDSSRIVMDENDSNSNMHKAINTAPASMMESDAATLTMYTKEVINTYKAGITTQMWNGKIVELATLHDICVENNIDDSENFYEREIGGTLYRMVWAKESNSNAWKATFVSDDSIDGTLLNGDVVAVTLDLQ